MSGLNKDDIIRMAREAGYIGFQFTSITTLERFANLVAAATLKNSVMTDEEYEQAMADEGQRRMLSFDNDVRAMIKAAVDAEREACAVIAFNAKTYLEAAAAIRARGNDAA